MSAKAGLEGLTHALARELGSVGITANCVAPGSIRVPAEDTVVDDPEAMTARQFAHQCVQRRGRPEDVAAAVAFLATDDAGFITGQTLRVDGRPDPWLTSSSAPSAPAGSAHTCHRAWTPSGWSPPRPA
ncbi:SDR family oxidoreductase [Streptomyces halstedii]|uniref:SDR family oxidoreductase n=1 Tax=Streptomyces halstedii TaxID=1944 RepID=UPI0038706AEA